ncbi:DUF2065 domain-containing protein [Segnochrobactraceae bacterium EtOH-i3]
MSDLLVALGLVMAIEGTLYALAPGALKGMMRQALELPDQVLRIGGVAALAVGVLVVWLARG